MSDLAIPKGVTWAARWPVNDDAGEPADVAEWELWAQVRPSRGSPTVLHEWSVANDNVELGEGYVQINVDHADSTDWTWQTGYYDVLLTSPADVRTLIDQGTVRVTVTVTRDDPA